MQGIIDRIGSKKIESPNQDYYDFINLLHYTRILSPYSMKILKDIRGKNGILQKIKYETEDGSFFGSEDGVFSRFIQPYQNKDNFNGYRLGMAELVNGGHLNIHPSEDNKYLYIGIPTATKILILYITGKV